MSDEYAGGGLGRSLVVGDWRVTQFIDGTVTQQVIINGNVKIGALISLTGAANAGTVTLSDGVNSYIFAAGSIAVGGQFFGGGMRLDSGLITLANNTDRIMVLYRESDFEGLPA
ncbi:hypothetical protein MNBD_ALPHA03-1271 [hydrothermal vent metagenome]|uniref:Uncharacterized protein n=1 Tax=hydrothermal vent metagenome TaxID=652676 RepID=A0A3B1APR3_9ZZZZ